MGTASKRKHHQAQSDSGSEFSNEDNHGKKQKTIKKGRTANAPSWTEEQGKYLLELCRQYDAAGTRKKWGAITKAFAKQFPSSKKTWNALNCQYRSIKRITTALSHEEKVHFAQAVDDIRRNRVFVETVKWRFEFLSKNSTTLSKMDVKQMLKEMKEWDLGGEEKVSSSPLMIIEDSNGEEYSE